MPSKPRSRSTTATRGKTNPAAASPDLVFAAVAPMLKVAQQLRRWTDGVLGLVGPAGELSLNLAKAGTKGPRQLQAIEKAASLLRRARESAGMTTQELGKVTATSTTPTCSSRPSVARRLCRWKSSCAWPVRWAAMTR